LKIQVQQGGLEIGHKSGKELKRLMVAVSASVLVLLLAIIAYFMADIIITNNKNIEHNKERMIQESVRSLNDIGESIDMTSIGPSVMELFNKELIQKVLSGDIEALHDYALKAVQMFYPVDYVGILVEGKLVDYSTKQDIVIDPEEMPADIPEGEYQTLDRLGDREGFFVSVFLPMDMSVFGMSEFSINRTQELADIENFFSDQRNDLLIRLVVASVIAIMLSLLLTTIGLRYFTRKYVVNPIEELNHAAEKIMDGSYKGDMEVDESSAFAALQGLLRSGQMVLRKMDDEIGE
jgi:hypothetical protein